MIIIEWCVSELDETGEPEGLHFCARYSEALYMARALGPQTSIELMWSNVRDHDLSHRKFARVENGKLPATFSDGTPVPPRFRRQVDWATRIGDRGLVVGA